MKNVAFKRCSNPRILCLVANLNVMGIEPRLLLPLLLPLLLLLMTLYPGADDRGLVTPQSEDEEEGEEDTSPALTPGRPGVTTAPLAKEAAARAGITKKRPGEDRNTKEPPPKRTTTARAVGRRESLHVA